MIIEVRLFAYLRDNRGKKLKLELEEGTTIGKVLEKLSIKEDEASIILKNGRDGSLNSILEDGDILSLFPPVGGG